MKRERKRERERARKRERGRERERDRKGLKDDSLSELRSSSCKPGRYVRYSLCLLPFSLHSSHSSHCINPLRRFAQSCGSTRGLLRSERAREGERVRGEKEKEREREK